MPGDAHCHEVSPCGPGEYGDIPGQDDPTTQYVNGIYQGVYSDGTRDKPWRRIQDGVDHAQAGAIVAVAAGNYHEDVLIQYRPVRLWGKCPGMVEVTGAGVEAASLQILSQNANGSEIHTLALTGPRGGMMASGATGVVADHVRIHDTMDRGLDVEGSAGPASLMMTASLIEAAKDEGVVVVGAEAEIDATTVRATAPADDGTRGFGIHVNGQPAAGHPRAKLTLRGSLVEQNQKQGMVVTGSDATIEGTVVRTTQPDSDGVEGIGINAQRDPDTGERAKVALRGSLVDKNRGSGVIVQGSDMTIEASVVRATQPYSDGSSGRGVEIHWDPVSYERSSVTIQESLVDGNQEIGVFVGGSDATIEATVVRGTQSRGDGQLGHGIAISADPNGPQRATLALRTSLIEDNHEIGVTIFGSDATIDGTVVRGTLQDGDGKFGDGVVVAFLGQPAKATITSTDIEANDRAGIANFSAAVLLLSSKVECNPIDVDGEDQMSGPSFTFDGSKDNHFGCGKAVTTTMAVQSANLSAPSAIDPEKPPASSQ